MTELALASWYERAGRHDLPWRATRDRWAVLVSEVMLQQTQVGRVLDAWPAFMAQFPDVATAAAAGPGAVIAAWGRLGYPRRARRLWEAAARIDRDGWPDRPARAAGRRPLHRRRARRAGRRRRRRRDRGQHPPRRASASPGRVWANAPPRPSRSTIADPLRGRDRLLALMDLGATVCTARDPRCARCPIAATCATRGALADETRHRQARYEGSFRQRRGIVMAELRAHDTVAVAALDRDALASLVARRPRRDHRRDRATCRSPSPCP